MKNKPEQKRDTDDFFVYGKDFIFLSSKEKRAILKTAKTLMKLQQENNTVLIDALSLQVEGKKELV